MKKILILLSLIITAGCSNAQNAGHNADEHKAEEQQTRSKKDMMHIPHFHILTTDSVMITSANLKKNTPVMIIYFSPDCGHCQRMMYELKPKLNELKRIQVVMVTWSKDYDIRAIREFKRDYGLKDYPNFIIGTESYTMFVQKYFDVKSTPFIAVYDRKGNLSTTIPKMPKTSEILAAVKKV